MPLPLVCVRYSPAASRSAIVQEIDDLEVQAVAPTGRGPTKQIRPELLLNSATALGRSQSQSLQTGTPPGGTWVMRRIRR